ncbi:MAG TPA: TonB-dependent receptor [Gemmatimonadales bacterium]|nr:TonB-dependent receptor [Gemmatimonadales bacterium]
MRSHFLIAALAGITAAAPARAQHGGPVEGARLALAASGEVGRVVGVVRDASQGSPVAGVQVQVAGSGIVATSTLDGRYTLTAVPSGTVTLEFKRIGYQAKTVQGVTVPPRGVVQQDVALHPQVFQLEEVVVTSALAERGSVSRAVEEQRIATNMINTISMAQIEASPDGDAGQAVQRVSGVTVQDGKYVFVRGLGERYTTTSLNGSRVPSPEPERRVVPLDLFPSNLLEAVTTSKTFTPDQPGDFSGAQVDLRTREFPAGRSFSLSTSVGLNTEITGRTVLQAPVVGREWLALAGDARQMPQPARDAGTLAGATQNEINTIVASFRNAWSAEPRRGSPSGSMSVSAGGEDPILGIRLGYVGSLTYSTAPEIRVGERRALAVAGSGGTRPQNEYTGGTTRTSVLWGGLLNLSTRIGGWTKLSLNNMYDRSGENEATRLTGDNEEFGTTFDLTRLTFTERSVWSSQLAAQHLVASRHQLDWSATLSGVSRNEPDRSDVVYVAARDVATGQVTPEYWFGAPRSATRTFSALTESSRDLRASTRFAFGPPSREFGVKIGGSVRHTERDADSRAFDVINYSLDESSRAGPPERIFDGANAAAGRLGLFINANGGRYTASDDNTAAFVQLEVPLSDAVRLVGGARLERARLQVNSLSPQGIPAEAALDDTDLLPALTVNIALNDRHNLRLSASQTLSRPEYRELSPVSHFDVLGGLVQFGNPDLRRARIQNADIRWEWFPGVGEVISLGAFAKRFRDPIERVIVATTGAPTLGFVNAEAAHNYGLEAEVRRSLAGLAEVLAPFTLFGNATLMRSDIRPGNAHISALTSASRPMVGQAGYVVNAGVSYLNRAGDLSATVLYNVVGRRIQEAGALPLPDSYEEPRHMLDVAFRAPLWSTVAAKLDARNLLDSPFQVTQGDVIRHRYRTGRTFSVGFTWKPQP